MPLRRAFCTMVLYFFKQLVLTNSFTRIKMSLYSIISQANLICACMLVALCQGVPETYKIFHPFPKDINGKKWLPSPGSVHSKSKVYSSKGIPSLQRIQCLASLEKYSSFHDTQLQVMQWPSGWGFVSRC